MQQRQIYPNFTGTIIQTMRDVPDPEKRKQFYLDCFEQFKQGPILTHIIIDGCFEIDPVFKDSCESFFPEFASVV